MASAAGQGNDIAGDVAGIAGLAGATIGTGGMFELASIGIGLASSIFGTVSAASTANQISGIEQKNAGLELQVNQQRKNAMEIDARRRQLDVVRNNQRARSMALTTATNQGAQFGSGLQGAYGQIGGQANFNLAGVNQNLEIGRNVFGLDTQISQNKIALAGLKSSQATDMGIASIGGDISKSAGSLGSIGKQIGLFT